MSGIGNSMPLEELLSELGRWGLVSLEFKWGKWHCEVRMPGYTTPAPIMAYRRASGATSRKACEMAFEMLEDWRASGEMAQNRQHYLKSHRFLKERYDRASPAERRSFNRIDDPGEEFPERPLPRDIGI